MRKVLGSLMRLEKYVNLNEINRQLGCGNLHFTKTVKDCLESAAPREDIAIQEQPVTTLSRRRTTTFRRSPTSKEEGWNGLSGWLENGPDGTTLSPSGTAYMVGRIWLHPYLAIQCARPDMDLWLQVWFLPPIPIASDARLMKLQNNVTFVVWSFCSERSRRSHRRRLPR